MNRLILIAFVFIAAVFQAQTKKPVAPTSTTLQDTAVVTEDSLQMEEVDPYLMRHEFIVYSKRAKAKKNRWQLCLNLLNGDSVYNRCINDSLLRDPEKYQVLFQQENSDTAYFLVYVAAFTKDPNRPECMGGKEIKIFFIKWNTQTNKSTLKQKYIQSCQKGITQMSPEPVDKWDGQSELVVKFHRGAKFYDFRFDPKNYQLGMQGGADSEGN